MFLEDFDCIIHLKNPLLYIENVCILTNIQGKLLVTVDRMCSLSIFVCEFSTCLSSFQCFSRKTTWFHACYFQRPKDVFSLCVGTDHTLHNWPIFADSAQTSENKNKKVT